MRILEIGFYLLINACRIYIMYRFSRLFFGQEKQKRWLMHSYIAFYVANSMEYIVLNNDTVNLVVNIGGLLIIIICGYEGSIKRKLISFAASFGIALLAEDMAWVIFVKGRSEQMAEFGFFFSVSILLLIEIILEKSFKFHKDVDIPMYKDLLLILISVGSMFISVTMIEAFYHNKGNLVLSLCILLFIDITVFYLYDKMLEDYLKQKEKEMDKQQLCMYQNQLKIMQGTNEAYQSMRHDMKHHMFLIADYIVKNENDKALKYFEKINYHIENGEEHVKTGNDSIDSIFNYVIDEVEKNGGVVKADIKVAEGMAIDDFDINIILSNLLFNASEAVSKSDKKLIQIVMRYDRGVLTIKISNTYSGMIKRSGEVFLSTKPKGSEHGIGLANVKKAVEKYNGEMKIDFTEEEFVVRILMYI